MSEDPPAEPLHRALAAVDPLVAGIGDAQWSAPTPCTEWTVRDLVTHLVGGNRMITAALRGEPLPTRGENPLGDDPLGTYRSSAAVLRDTVQMPGVLDRTYTSPLGTSTGAERVKWRTADLLTHAWDLAMATGQPLDLPEDLVEESLAFVTVALGEQSRSGRFGPPQPVAEDAPAIDRLVAFGGRSVG
jgi:uncharacterized protein (TIGR03086 family)